MSLYPQTDLILAAVGIHRNDVERFRDVSYSDGVVYVYTRTGGGNRDDYPQAIMRSVAGWLDSDDDEGDCTYCTDQIRVDERWIGDMEKLEDILTHGLRRPFAQHLARTLRREPTEADRKQIARDSEERRLAATAHSRANGHTFVPHNDRAMETALEIAEANGGELVSFWGILPLRLEVICDQDRWGSFCRVEIDYKWVTDAEYLAHCVEKFGAKYPQAMARVKEESKHYL